MKICIAVMRRRVSVCLLPLFLCAPAVAGALEASGAAPAAGSGVVVEGLKTTKPDNLTQEQHYFNSAYMSYMTCFMQAESRMRACASTYRKALAEIYEATAAQVQSEAKKEALKAHYTQAAANLEEIARRPGESDAAYRRRREANEAKLEDLESKFRKQ